MDFGRISRRHLLQGGAALTLGSAFGARSAQAADTTIGFIYVGSRDDYGYNQAHAQGAAALKKMPGLKVVEEEKVPETDAVEKTIESMINLDGASLLFPTSFGYYNPHMIKMAKQVSETALRALRRAVERQGSRRTPAAISAISTRPSTFPGIVAGYSTKSGKLGFVAAKPIPQVLRNINAFTLGAKLANPKATTQVIFTGDWSMPVKEAEATNSLIDQGVDVLTCHVDGPKTMVENAARRGAMVCGYHVNQSPLAPKAYLTGAEWNWEALYPKFVKMIAAGEAIPNFYRGGLKEEIVKMLALWRGGLGRSAQACRRDQGQVLVRRRLHHLQGPDHRQQGQDRDRRRHRSRPEGSRTREDGLSGGGRDRSDFVTTEAADPVDAVGSLLRPPIPASSSATARPSNTS